MTHSFFVTTYYFSNLRISLPSIQRYIKQNLKYSFNLLLSNDNPNLKLTEEYISKFIDLSLFNKVVILNTDENLGQFRNRVKCIKRGYEEFQDCKYFMFVDDDDVVLNPTFDSNKLGIMHHGVVTHRLLEVLTLIQEPIINLNNKNFEYEEWKAGCVGNVFNLKEYYRFICDAEGWFPILYEIYGSKRIMEPDDVILHNMWIIWVSFIHGNVASLHDNVDRYSYSLTFLEDRVGRYYVEDGVCDLRYGENYNKSYMDIYNPIIEQFTNYMQNKINSTDEQNT